MDKVHSVSLMLSMCWIQAPHASQSVRVTGIHHGGRNRVVTNAAVREVLTTQQRQKLDSSPDSDFYSLPRFCNHADDQFIRTQRAVYEKYLGSLKPGERVTVLDLASSDRSHMPESIVFDTRYTFIGHGMNAEELARNPILDRWFIRDLNADPPSSMSPLAFEDESLDAVVCCCSIQYFQYPETLFADLRRALKPGGLVLVSFTNKAFWTKVGTAEALTLTHSLSLSLTHAPRSFSHQGALGMGELHRVRARTARQAVPHGRRLLISNRSLRPRTNRPSTPRTNQKHRLQHLAGPVLLCARRQNASKRLNAVTDMLSDIHVDVYSTSSSSSASGSGMAAASCSCFSYSACCCRSICTSGGANASCSTNTSAGSPTSFLARYKNGFS